MRKLFSLPIFLLAVTVQAQEVNIIPKPAEIEFYKGNFTITPSTKLVLYNSSLDKAATYFNNYLQKFYGFKLPIIRKPAILNAIIFEIGDDKDTMGIGAYKIIVQNDHIVVNGTNARGLFYAMQSLIQLLPPEKQKKFVIPQMMITDSAHFAYRGMHLDCGRHFFSVDFIKKYIDWIALHKMNYFHWHLTEDQGWRIEIKKYPKLTQVGAWRNGTIIGRYPGTGNDGIRYGGFYTQKQIKEIVKYAADRFITVIPEIEMPGHCSAAIASYPELSCFPDEPTKKYYPKQCAWKGDSTGKQVEQTWGVFDDVYCAGKESTFKFIEDVLDEVMALFPSKYIHVGGDECPKENWKRCPLCQKRIKDEGLKDEHSLQSYFIQRVEKYLNSKGKALIGWDEILEGGLAPNATVMSWRGEQGGIDAARQNHNVIMTPGGWCYFDHSQSENEDSVTIGGYTPVEKVYSYNPVPDSLNEEQAKHVLGAQGNVWTEYIGNERKVEYMIFPRMSALSEVLWSQKSAGSGGKDPADFERRLLDQFKRFDFWKVNYSKAYFDLKATVLPTTDFKGLNWKIQSKYSPPNCGYCYIKSIEEFIYEKDTVINDTIPVYDLNDPHRISKFDISKKVIKAGEKGIKANPSWRVFNDTVKTILVKESKTLRAWLPLNLKQKIEISQTFHFNKATGKKITLTNPPSKNYPGDGAFTLVNGVQNEKGTARSKEFLGFSGTDCEAEIDLGETDTITSVVVHIFNQQSSWIWRPQYVEVFSSADGQNFISLKMADDLIPGNGGNATMKVELNNPVSTRFVKVVVKNWGEIPQGSPGAGNKAWLFVDEIEVN